MITIRDPHEKTVKEGGRGMDSNKGWWVALSGMGLISRWDSLCMECLQQAADRAVDKGGSDGQKLRLRSLHRGDRLFRIHDGPAGRLQDKIGREWCQHGGCLHRGWSRVVQLCERNQYSPCSDRFRMSCRYRLRLGYSAATPRR